MVVLAVLGAINALLAGWYLLESSRIKGMVRTRKTVTHLHLKGVRSAGLALAVSLCVTAVTTVTVLI